MQQPEYRNSIQSSQGIGEEVEFGVEVNETIFQMLSSDVYNDPTLAVMREWSTNACDACLAAGLLVDYEVHIPTVEEPFFYVRDKGTGLHPDTVKTLFSKLGNSTKRDSNVLNGCLGIGRMAGLAVADAFTVESYYNGMLYSFVVSMKNGRPVIIPLSEAPTDEPNGLKLSVAVNYEDICSYIERVDKLYPYFDYKPKLNIEADLHLDMGEEDWFIGKGLRGNYVLMSQVLYLIPKADEIKDYGFNSLVLKADPGTVTFNPGRESLSLNKATVEQLNSRFAETKEAFIAKALEEYDNAETDADVMRCYQRYHAASPHSLISDINPYDYLSDYAKSLCTVSYSGHAQPDHVLTGSTFNSLTNYRVTIHYKMRYNSTARSMEKVSAHYNEFYFGRVILVDRKRSSRQRLNEKFSSSTFVVWSRPQGIDFDAYLQEAKKVLDLMGIEYELYSDLIPEEEATGKNTQAREGFYASRVDLDAVRKNEYMTGEEVDNGEWLYLKLSGSTPQLKGDIPFDVMQLMYRYMAKVTDMPKVRGVSKKYQAFVDSKDNWLDYETFIMDKLKDVSFTTDMEEKFSDITMSIKGDQVKFPDPIQTAYGEMEKYYEAKKAQNFISKLDLPAVDKFKERVTPYVPDNPDFYEVLERDYPVSLKLLNREVNIWSRKTNHILDVALLEEQCNAIRTTDG